MANTKKLTVGTLLARTEAPTVKYRVTSVHPWGYRLLPYRAQGREVALVRHGGLWCGDGSSWEICK